MSKIGRKPILLNSVKAEIKGNTVLLSGAKGKVSHEVYPELTIKLENNSLTLGVKEGSALTRDIKMQWGLNRALIANKIIGMDTGFEENVRIVGLGYKAQITGSKMVFSLGYSHKIEYNIPKDVSITVDKTGQIVNVKSTDKWLLGNTCDTIRSFRRVEPYKGTGIIRANEVVIRKAGKSKASAS